MFIRPVTRNDTDAVLMLAKAAGIGMLSLPAIPDVLEAKVERAAQSFEQTLDDPNDALYLFLLEDETTGDVAGICGIEAHIGLKRPVYSYKITTVTQYSDSLDIFSRNDMLQIVNDYSGVSEMVSLFLLPDYRRNRLGRFLSRVRFIFMALHRAYFDDRIIAEIRGWHDGKGNAPFYDSLAKQFFRMDFAQADMICATQGNRFISELMPTYPIYINLLPKAAQEVIGKPYDSSAAAKAMLEREGFFYNNYIDIFDGGPTIEARTDEVHTIAQSSRGNIGLIGGDACDNHRAIIATTGFADFRAVIGHIREGDMLAIDAVSAKQLGVGVGDEVIYAAL